MKILLEGIVGSTAYGLATATSDVDKLGIMQLPIEHFLGLSSPLESSLSKVTTEPDVTYHDVGKFCRLALGCNPTVTELLWLPKEFYLVKTLPGIELIWMREDFLSAPRVRDAYLGYATSQLHRLMDRESPQKRIEKNARHLLRLLHQGYTLFTTGELPITLEDPERYHEFGRLVAENPQHAKDTIDEYQRIFRDVRSVLPEKPKTEEISEWVRDLRMQNW